MARDIESEAGVIATLLYNPEYYFHAEGLKAQYFSDAQNQYLYAVIAELVRRGITKIDSYILISVASTMGMPDEVRDAMTVGNINELIALSAHTVLPCGAQFVVNKGWLMAKFLSEERWMCVK